MRHFRDCCVWAAVAAATLSALLAVSMADAQAGPIDVVLDKLKADGPARKLTEENFEHDTQASGAMTSGNWLILFVPGSDGATTDRRSPEAVSGIVSFDSFVRLSTEVLRTYQVVPAYVLCDESPSLCKRFEVTNSSAKLVVLSARRMYPYPAEQIRSMSDLELFVSDFRRIDSSAVPPPLPGMMKWGQLILLLGGAIGTFLLWSFTLRRTSAPLPPSMATFHSKTD
ncbi:hypothetical protein LSCM1_03879 [Leishmania martiniquensis]|uniref:Uncharacterized protein n=1 Tax=Leishmania martiniquensis TaxID=1580590 RepID=A0A836H8T0_9TRYP|nr:hypothetical protein LSCM1_03879 [Leishmania martiniquensis]